MERNYPPRQRIKSKEEEETEEFYEAFADIFAKVYPILDRKLEKQRKSLGLERDEMMKLLERGEFGAKLQEEKTKILEDLDYI